jgi:hypothetical protein
MILRATHNQLPYACAMRIIALVGKVNAEPFRGSERGTLYFDGPRTVEMLPPAQSYMEGHFVSVNPGLYQAGDFSEFNDWIEV